MKYAGKSGIPYAAVIGADEMASGTLALKDMLGGNGQRTVTIEEAIKILKEIEE